MLVSCVVGDRTLMDPYTYQTLPTADFSELPANITVRLKVSNFEGKTHPFEYEGGKNVRFPMTDIKVIDIGLTRAGIAVSLDGYEILLNPSIGGNGYLSIYLF